MEQQDDDDRPTGDDDDAYVLDLEEGSVEDVDAVTREALRAVGDRPRGVQPAAEAPGQQLPRAGGSAGDTAGRGGEAAAADAASDAEIAALQAELADLRDRSVRTLADFENYRRRSEKERDDLRRFAIADVLRDFLPVVDNLQRALTAGGAVEDLKLGVELTLRQFQDLLRQRGVIEVPAVGSAFDPTVHEAVAREEDASVQAPTVTAELQRGYTLHGRLLRPALVKVAMPAESDES